MSLPADTLDTFGSWYPEDDLTDAERDAVAELAAYQEASDAACDTEPDAEAP